MTRLNAVGYRLNVAATPLCPASMAGTGIAVDYIDAYDSSGRPGVMQLLGMTEAPQVAAVAPNSPADQAGIQAGDDILAIDGAPTATDARHSDNPALFADELEKRLGAYPVGKPIHLDLRRGSRTFDAKIIPVSVCAARFVIKTQEGMSAYSDGRNVAFSSKYIDFAINDDELALIAGHELAHVVNGDGDAKGLSDRRNKEDRADLLGAGLARCAGFKPEMGVEFWLRYDSQDWLRLFRDPTHRSRKERVARIRGQALSGPCPPTLGLAHGPS